MTESTIEPRPNAYPWTEDVTLSDEEEYRGQRPLKLLPAPDLRSVGFPENPCRSIVVPVPSNYRPAPSASTQIRPLTLERSILSSTSCASQLMEDSASVVSFPQTGFQSAFMLSGASEVFAETVYLFLTSDVPTAPSEGSLSIWHQLEELKDLVDGWAEGMQPAAQWGEGFGKAPSHQGLDWLAGQFDRYYPVDLPRPYIYPTSEGNIQAEWSLGTCEVSLEVHFTDHSGEWDWLNLRTGTAGERVLDLDDQANWEWLKSKLRQLESQAE